MRRFLVDIGNSAIKIRQVNELTDQYQVTTAAGQDIARAWAQQRSRFDAPTQRIGAWSDFNWRQLDQRPCQWIVASVNTAVADELGQRLNERRPEDQFMLVGFDSVGLDIQIDAPAAVGIDRLVACRAAFDRIDDGNAIVVDAGTAVTIDCITRRGEFKGGVIYPGPAASFRQLQQQTAALPKIDFSYRQQWLTSLESNSDPNGGRPPWRPNTVDAIATGVFQVQLAGLQKIVDQYLNALAAPTTVFLTGGGLVELLSAANGLKVPVTWNAVACIRPDLVLEGLNTIDTSLPEDGQ